MKRTLAFAVVAALLADCWTDRRPSSSRAQISAANALTERYAQSVLARWQVHGRAAGPDCKVLFIETTILMEDAMVEALHYGAGAYDIYKGGVQQFSQERGFRGVAYRDKSGRVWRFGQVGPAETLTACR